MTTDTKKRHNIIWIFGDQHRAQALGYNGDPHLHTPNIDLMYRQGMSFGNAVSGCPWCTPFRGSLLTSRYPNNCVIQTPQRMDPQFPTIADTFNEAGYETAYFGKWHLDGKSEAKVRSGKHVVPKERRGRFQSWIGYENNNAQFDCWVHGHDRKGEEVDLYRLPKFETDALTDLTVEYLKVRAREMSEGTDDRPFFAVLSVQPPHGPYTSTPESMAKHTPGQIQLRPNVPEVGDVPTRARRNLAGYYALIENLDMNVGRVMQTLDELDLRDTTHVIFFSDHGDCHGSHGYFEKSSPWEESVRIPFTISGGPTEYGLTNGECDAPINHVDIAPTTLGLCGIDVPDWMAGFDYSRYRMGRVSGRLDDEPEEALMQHCVRKLHKDGIDREWRGIVTRDRWKYVVQKNAPLMMFNLNEDPYEQYNMAFNQRYLKERQALQERLAARLKAVGDDFELPEI